MKGGAAYDRAELLGHFLVREPSGLAVLELLYREILPSSVHTPPLPFLFSIPYYLFAVSSLPVHPQCAAVHHFLQSHLHPILFFLKIK